MIELSIKPYCHNCNKFEPQTDVSHMVIDTFDPIEQKHIFDTKVSCIHEHRCEALYGYLQNQKKEEKSNE